MLSKKKDIETLAKIWGSAVYKIKQAWDWLVLGEERQRKGSLNRAEVLVFLLDALQSPEVDCLTVSSAANLYCCKFGQSCPTLVTFHKYLQFLVKKMPEEIVVDRSRWPWRYFTPEKMAQEAVQETERLRRLIKENKGILSEIKISLKEQGVGIGLDTLLARINQNEELRELAKQAKQAGKTRSAEERFEKNYPGKEELRQLLVEYQANMPQITEFLRKQGKKVYSAKLSKLVYEDEELRKLAKKIRYVLRYPWLPDGPKEKRAEEDLPLSKEEVEVLSAYQEGDSTEVLINKTKKPGGRVDSLVISILFRKHVATLGEAKLKSQEELVIV